MAKTKSKHSVGKKKVRKSRSPTAFNLHIRNALRGKKGNIRALFAAAARSYKHASSS